jgi:hypothetical protein
VKTCPTCGLVNSDVALRCDCGFEFDVPRIPWPSAPPPAEPRQADPQSHAPDITELPAAPGPYAVGAHRFASLFGRGLLGALAWVVLLPLGLVASALLVRALFGPASSAEGGAQLGGWIVMTVVVAIPVTTVFALGVRLARRRLAERPSRGR